MDTMLHQMTMPRHWRSPLVFASPHSGRVYSPAFLEMVRLDPVALRSSEDAYVDEFLDLVPDLGAPMLQAHAPRAFIDMNRAVSELDPSLIAGLPRGRHSPRVAAGLGVIPRVVAANQRIYAGRIHAAEAQARIEVLWHPYHADLKDLLTTTRRRFGQAILIDVHSMPSLARAGAQGTRPDIVLGDRHGSSASPEVTGVLQAAFQRAGFSVARNVPFAGAYITKTYGRPQRGFHCVQVEIDRGLYLDEARVAKSADFPAVSARLARVWGEVVEVFSGGVGALAAE